MSGIRAESAGLERVREELESMAELERAVVRGKWMLVDTADGDRDDTLLMTWKCSRCGQEFKTSGRLDFDFCPNCGAKMDGGRAKRRGG